MHSLARRRASECHFWGGARAAAGKIEAASSENEQKARRIQKVLRRGGRGEEPAFGKEKRTRKADSRHGGQASGEPRPGNDSRAFFGRLLETAL